MSLLDAEEVAGVEIVLLWAVPNVRAELASWALRSLKSLRRTPSRSGRRWQAVAGRRRRWVARRWRSGFCDPSATSSAVLFRSWVGASAPVHRQSGQCTRWRASWFPLLCTETGTHRVLSFQLGAETRLLHGGL